MKRIYGYCRISTPKQSIDRQIRNIAAEFPSARIVTEAYTGTKIHRPAWDKLLRTVQAGDTIVFDSVSRMSRNAEDGCSLYMELYNKGINLVFLKERHIDTAVYQGAVARHIDITADTGRESVDKFLTGQGKLFNELMLDLAKEQIKLAFDQAEKEVDDLRQRTREGLETARRNGKTLGQKTGSKWETAKAAQAKAVIWKHSKDFTGTLNDTECKTLAGVCRNAFYKYKGELRELYSLWLSETSEPGSNEWRESLTEEEQEFIAKLDNQVKI